jgi:hypothetical protein
MADLEAITTQIQTRLGEQNQILKNCVTKYQESNKNNQKIADQISKITEALAQHTTNLKTLESQHNLFKEAKAKKEQDYLNDKQTMEEDNRKEKERLEQEKEGQLKAAQDHENQVKTQITEEQERLKREALEAAEKRKEEEDAKKKEAFDQAQNASKEAAEKAKREMDEFKEKITNEKKTMEEEQKKLADQHTSDLATATTNEEKLLKMQNEIIRLKEESQNSNTKHDQDLEELKTKSQADMEAINTEHDAAIEELRTKLAQHEAEALAIKEEEHKSLMENLMQRQEQKVSASANTSQAKIQELETQIEQCDIRYNTAQKLYDDNTAQIKQLNTDMEAAEAAAGQALLESVNKAAEENVKLKAQISKMTEGQPPAPQSDVPNVPIPTLTFDDISEQRRLAILEAEKDLEGAFLAKKNDTDFWKQGVEKHQQIWNFFEESGGFDGYGLNEDEKKILKERWFATNFEGGYKHGKSSKKKNKRSLKSKLTAKKFSLKKRSKRGKRKGRSKKRRKSIKIRI